MKSQRERKRKKKRWTHSFLVLLMNYFNSHINLLPWFHPSYSLLSLFLSSQVLDNKRKWWEVKNSSGQMGYVPSTILEVIQPSLGSSGPSLNYNHSNSSHELPQPSPPISDPSNHSREIVSQVEVHAPPPVSICQCLIPSFVVVPV